MDIKYVLIKHERKRRGLPNITIIGIYETKTRAIYHKDRLYQEKLEKRQAGVDYLVREGQLY